MLVDAPTDDFGGSGQTFNWSRLPKQRGKPLVLAGGLNVDNVERRDRRSASLRSRRQQRGRAATGQKEHDKDRRVYCRSTARRSTRMKPYDLPDSHGHFGPYGGIFVAETLMHALDELRSAYLKYQHDPEFVAEFQRELKHFVGRPSPIYHARRWSELLGGAQIYLKREDLNHTGAHKINNTVGQALLAKRMGKPRVIAETGAGQHGVATATVAARYAMECVVYMGEEDMARQAANVYRMKLLGATVVPVSSGSRTLKDALNEAMRDWVTNVENTFYIIGTVAGPHPYPMMVRDFNSVVGKECIEQMPEIAGRQPDAVIACVGGGSNAMGIFYDYISHKDVKLIGVEAAGEGLASMRHAASLQRGVPGVLHGNRTYLLQNEDGQIMETHSVSAGPRLPGGWPRARVAEGRTPRRIRRRHR